MKNEGLKRVLNLGEITYLKLKKIPLKKVDTYERKSICWFENHNNESEDALLDYYNSEFSTFYNTLKDTKIFLFNRLNENKDIK